MADRSAWVSWAFRRYHAGQLTLHELLAMVRAHRGDQADLIGDPDA